ncbi:hypothetical protein AOCH_003729 [Aspergillus ochraceoroseus]|uniref:tripeptidyl-peptidase II n=1 Tax=Aspergillus ochraceoroseus TaxID=138278 RepID=A0A0F8UZX0_9EURO|nr:hypothetical protein AOCH_003729 [Aspergillus ochraceoroseus]
MPSSLSRIAALTLAGLSCLTSPVAAAAFEREQWVNGCPGWKYNGVPAGNQPIRLRIALHQHNAAGFERALLDMSTPGHPDYGKHYGSYDEMKRMLLPTGQSVTTVTDWLTSAGITEFEEDADWINFRTTVDVANKLLDADFLWYTHGEQPARVLRTLEYSVPDDVASHINMIQPTTRFGQIRANRATLRYMPGKVDERRLMSAVRNGSTDHCDDVVTPQCLHKLYRTEGYQAVAARGSKIGFASYLEEYARYADLAAFEAHYAPHAIGQNFTVVQFHGGLNQQNATSDSGEANLDLQYIIGVSAPLPVTEYSTGGRGKLVPDLSEPDPSDNENEPYLEFLDAILKLPQEELPQVISTSYGEDEQTIPEQYARSVCNMYGQLGSRGVSVLFSSGDSGVGAACQTNDAAKRTHFPPQFPASCPWVTSVGGTNGTQPEAGVYFSSGGFSDLWARPSYQDSAVAAYLDILGDTWSDYFNRSGRAFPDVAAQSTNFAVVDQGSVGLFAGTSCACPVFSAVVALLNDARLQAGLPVMGFLNPWLYKTGAAGLNDIVHGGSKGCDGQNRFGGTPNGSPVIPYASWNATQGWDPVTGLGTPDFVKLKTLALRR